MGTADHCHHCGEGGHLVSQCPQLLAPSLVTTLAMQSDQKPVAAMSVSTANAALAASSIIPAQLNTSTGVLIVDPWYQPVCHNKFKSTEEERVAQICQEEHGQRPAPAASPPGQGALVQDQPLSPEDIRRQSSIDDGFPACGKQTFVAHMDQMSRRMGLQPDANEPGMYQKNTSYHYDMAGGFLRGDEEEDHSSAIACGTDMDDWEHGRGNDTPDEYEDDGFVVPNGEGEEQIHDDGLPSDEEVVTSPGTPSFKVDVAVAPGTDGYAELAALAHRLPNGHGGGKPAATQACLDGDDSELNDEDASYTRLNASIKDKGKPYDYETNLHNTEDDEEEEEVEEANVKGCTCSHSRQAIQDSSEEDDNDDDSMGPLDMTKPTQGHPKHSSRAPEQFDDCIVYGKEYLDPQPQPPPYPNARPKHHSNHPGYLKEHYVLPGKAQKGNAYPNQLPKKK